MFSPTLNNLLFQRTLFGRERYLKRFSTIDKVESTDVSKWHFSELTAKLMERRSTPCWKLLGLKRLFCVASAYDPETMLALCAIAPRRQPPGPAFLRFTNSSRIHRPRTPLNGHPWPWRVPRTFLPLYVIPIRPFIFKMDPPFSNFQTLPLCIRSGSK